MIFRILIAFFFYPVNPVDPVRILRSGLRKSMQYSIRHGERGFTLIELLIAMAISLVVLTSISIVFITHRKAYDVQEQITEMIQNGRAAMDMMSGEIRMTGYGAPPTSNLSTWISWVTSPTIDDNPKIVDGGGANPDEIYIVACFGGPGTTLSADASAGDTTLSVEDGSKFNTNKKKVISINGLENAVIKGISGDTLTIDTDPATTGNQGLDNTFASGASVCIVKVIGYSIVDNTLKRNENTGAGRQPVAENMVDLQVSKSGKSIEISPLTAQTAKPDPGYAQNGGYREYRLRSLITPPNLLIED